MDEPKTPPQANAAAPHDLSEETTKRIDDAYVRLEACDFYEALGLERTATRAEVRSAFLKVAPVFHPDRYYGRKLGVYKERMQRVFASLSLAHDTLEHETKRAEYDRTLPPPAASMPPPMAKPRFAPPSSAGRAPGTPASPIPPPPSERPPPSMRPPTTTSPEIERARQQAFAARLSGNSARTRPPTPVAAFSPSGQLRGAPGAGRDPSSPSHQAIDPKAATEALKRRYEETVAQARGKQQASNDLQAARAAEARGDFVEAARLYRIALGRSSDPALKATTESVELRAKQQMLEQMIARGKDADEKQDYMAAGVAWGRAFELSANADTAHRAAVAFLRTGTDPRRAARFGEEAVKLEPSKAMYRVTLSRIYGEAGLLLRARGEIERALALDPKNPQVKEAAAKFKGR